MKRFGPLVLLVLCVAVGVGSAQASTRGGFCVYAPDGLGGKTAESSSACTVNKKGQPRPRALTLCDRRDDGKKVTIWYTTLMDRALYYSSPFPFPTGCNTFADAYSPYLDVIVCVAPGKVVTEDRWSKPIPKIRVDKPAFCSNHGRATRVYS